MFKFKNVGHAIKEWARTLAILEFFLAIIIAVGFFINEKMGLGWLVILGGIFVAYFSNILLFAFGQIVDDIHCIRENTQCLIESQEQQETNQA